MPMLIRFLLSRFADGAVLGLAVTQVLLMADFARLNSMLAGGGQDLVMLLLFVQAALLFGTLNMAVAVLTLPRDRP